MEEKHPVWIEDMLEKRKTHENKWDKTTGYEGHGWDLASFSYMCKTNPRSKEQPVSTKIAEKQMTSTWHILSLNEACKVFELTVDGLSIENIICILQKCRKNKNLQIARSLYAHICKKGLEGHRTLGNYIVPMFVECGSVPDAQEAFDRLRHRNEFSWTSLIAGYIECGKSLHALSLYPKMQADGISPSRHTLTALLRACARTNDIERGRQIHGDIMKLGLESNVFVGSTLVDMYAKCSSLSEAQAVFDNIPARNVVGWTALIAGYVEHGFGQKVLHCYEEMQMEGVSPNIVTYAYVLKACAILQAINKGRQVHAEIAQCGCEKDLIVGSNLIDMYAKCGSLFEAQQVFDRLPLRDAVAWTAMIASFAENELPLEALSCFEQMQKEGIPTDAVTLVCSLKVCASIGAVIKGREIHAGIAHKGPEREPYVGQILVDMYAKCGSLTEAETVFDKLHDRNVVCWTALISGYVDYGFGQKALQCFNQLQLEGIAPDAVIFTCCLKACGGIRAIDRGREIHNEVLKQGLEKDIIIGNSLIDMYMKCGTLIEACKIFNSLPAQDVVSWNALISGHAEDGFAQVAMKLFEEMNLGPACPNFVTFICSLKCCGNIGAISKGRAIHAEIVLEGLEEDLCVANGLIDMYVKCNSLAEAQEVFDKVPHRNVVSWNAIMAGHVDNGHSLEATKCYEQLGLESVSPNPATFVFAVKAYADLKVLDKRKEIHTKIVTHGFENDPLLGNAMVDMYAKGGFLIEAREVFDTLKFRTVVSWNSLISGYVENGHGEEALKCFEQMHMEGICPDAVTFVCALKACECLGAVDKGHEIHTEIAQKGFEKDMFVGTSLVDMYAKAGSLLDAHHVFENLLVKDVTTWNAMIRGFSINFKSNMAVECFEDMCRERIQPDGVTFVCLLSACSRASLVTKGCQYFKSMRKKYGISRTIDHYTCMVDLLARTGHLHEAEMLLLTAPYSASEEALKSLLNACRSYGESELGLKCFQHLVQKNPGKSSSYVLMANIYAGAGILDEA